MSDELLLCLPLLSCPCGGEGVAELYRPRRRAHPAAGRWAFVARCPRCGLALVDLPENVHLTREEPT